MRRRIGMGWLAAGIGLAAVVVGAAAAQDTAPPPRERPHVRVYPLSRYYRRCDFWLAVEHRPSGDVLTPQQKCVWALR
jgi:hypothetical protein